MAAGRRVVFLAMITIATPVAAMCQAPTPSGCDALERSISQSEKTMSMIWAEGITDDSAPRATLREQKTTNELQLVATNTAIAIQLKCPPRKQPVARNAYLSPALKCVTARMKQGSGDTSRPEECDMSTWNRDDR